MHASAGVPERPMQGTRTQRQARRKGWQFRLPISAGTRTRPRHLAVRMSAPSANDRNRTYGLLRPRWLRRGAAKTRTMLGWRLSRLGRLGLIAREDSRGLVCGSSAVCGCAVAAASWRRKRCVRRFGSNDAVEMKTSQQRSIGLLCRMSLQ
jgi:hypothetical protein